MINKLFGAVLFVIVAGSLALAGSSTILYQSAGTIPFAITTDGSGNAISRQTIWDYNAAANGTAVDAGHSLQVAGEGTAGTPAGGVVSIQGVTSGTGITVSQGTAANLNATEANSAAILSAIQGAIPAGTNSIGSIAPLVATSTQTKVTITTAGTYQQYLSASSTRKGCTIQFITASHTGYVFFGSAPGDTTTSFQLSPGQALNCIAGDSVLTDAVQLTSSNNSDVFVVNSW